MGIPEEDCFATLENKGFSGIERDAGTLKRTAAHMLRDAEVAGSNPVASTPHRGSRKSF